MAKAKEITVTDATMEAIRRGSRDSLFGSFARIGFRILA